MAILKHLDVVFSNSVLEQKVAELLRRHACQRRWTPSLPVPVDSLIEHTLDLCIEYDTIDEPPGATIWGSIEPARKTITLNGTHTDSFAKYPGLERFTLGHEVGHWVMHVNQSELDQASLFDSSPEVIVCRDGDESVRERVADRFAAFLLMPTDLLWQELPRHDVTSRTGFCGLAEKIKVSNSALHLRLAKMGVAHSE